MIQARLSIDEIRSIEIGILDHIDAVCKANGLGYYLAYGTLLGAIRHKGFIPWDDDIDIYMCRGDYDKFIALARQAEPGRYMVLARDTEPSYYYEFAKVVDTRTEISPSNDILKINHEGVWVDIFPLDRVPKARGLAKRVLNAFVAMRILSVYKSFPMGKFNGALYPFWSIARLIGPRFFQSITDRLARAGKGNESVGYMCSMGVSKYDFPKAWCDEVVEVDFEGKKYPAFKEYDNYLRYQYGDYMQLPPKEKQVAHHYQCFLTDAQD